MWIINCLLLMLGTVSATLGISFYARNSQAANKIRFYILFYGIFSAVWCICYGVIGIMDNLDTCEMLRKVGVIGVDGFLLTEVFLVSEMSGLKRGIIRVVRIGATLISVVDYFWFAQSKVDTFIRERAWTTWQANPDGQLNRTIHTIYIVLIFLILISLGISWIINKVSVPGIPVQLYHAGIYHAGYLSSGHGTICDLYLRSRRGCLQHRNVVWRDAAEFL